MNEYNGTDAVNRREFLDRSTKVGLALAAGGLALNAGSAVAEKASSDSIFKVGAFTKSFQDRPVSEVCRIFKKIGLDGLDLTCRPGGHIDPKDAATEIPKAVAAAKAVDVEVLFLTTSITDPDADAERILATAADQGIDRFKMGYFRYTKFGTLRKQLDETKKRIESVAKLAAKYKVKPCVHIHSGAFLPSHGTQLYQLLRDFDPNDVGAYVDPLHMTKEGAGDGWRQGLDLLAPWISLCSVKNFIFEEGPRDKNGQLSWHTRTVPPAEGIAPLPAFVSALKQLGYTGPFSMHSEYKGSHSWKNLDTDGCIKQTAIDVKFFRGLL